MSISVQVNLPAQPAVGSVAYLPLGGNGWLAPKSMFMVDVHLVGDGSGGVLIIDVGRDERFEHVIDFLQVQSDNAAGIDFRFDIFRAIQNRAMQCGTSTIDPAATQSAAIWSPPAIVDPEEIRLTVDNVDGDIVKLKAMIYNFNIRASEKIPLNVMLSSVQKSTTLT